MLCFSLKNILEKGPFEIFEICFGPVSFFSHQSEVSLLPAGNDPWRCSRYQLLLKAADSVGPNLNIFYYLLTFYFHYVWTATSLSTKQRAGAVLSFVGT